MTFTSVGVDINDQVAGLASFHIHGALHYLMGALIPSNDDIQPSYAQLYIYDSQQASNAHAQYNSQFNSGILLDLHNMLRESHPYAAVYEQAHDVMRVSHFLLYIFDIYAH